MPGPVFAPSADAMLDAGLIETAVRHGLEPMPGGKYRHYDTLRRMTPPGGLDLKAWWLSVKLARRSLYRAVPLRDTRGVPFVYAMVDAALAMLHQIDSRAHGGRATSEQVTNSGTRNQYLVRSLMEEAITSSQLEGASTTRRVAKEMLESGRAARTHDERMILNNYEAMRFVRENVSAALTPDIVLEIHRIVTAGTLDNEGGSGRLRRVDEVVVVADSDNLTVHTPPAAKELPERLRQMCAFANGIDGKGPFLHPVVRAIVLHFWLAYDHPFVDGNGRTARALFYWSMLSHGYWLAEFISISKVIKRSRVQYSRSFLYVETDDNDATYFLLSQMKFIVTAIGELEQYLAAKTESIHAVEAMLRSTHLSLNHRQLAVLTKGLKQPNYSFTFESHQKAHNVVYQTARTDLLRLESLGLLTPSRAAKKTLFHVPADLEKRLRRR